MYVVQERKYMTMMTVDFQTNQHGSKKNKEKKLDAQNTIPDPMVNRPMLNWT